jgi:hypothetical protein
MGITRKIKDQCKKSISKFESSVMPLEWLERSILLSEGFAVCAIGDMRNIDMFIESGIYNGRSTQIWAKYFDSIPVIAIDIVLREETIKRLNEYKNIKLLEGDGVELVRKTINNNPSKRIGVFLDGPKSMAAIALARKIIKHDAVKYVAMHDLCRKRESRSIANSWKRIGFYSDEQWFVDKYSFLDKEESQRDSVQHTRWVPGKYLNDDGGDKVLKSYGPTVGIAI